jgi:prepilin-type N-terminal cleavage/methylation domain-containing protein
MSRLDQATTTTGQRAGRPAPSGFTLVELLVVIMIIAMLAGLVTPAVMRAQASARNAAIKAEIDMLHMAMMNYRNEYEKGFPPCSDTLLAIAPATPTPLRVRNHIVRLFPKSLSAITSEMAALNTDPLMNNSSTTIVNPLTLATILSPYNALYFWLSGYGDASDTPLTSGRKPLFDFDKSRIQSTTSPPGQYSPRNLAGYPYIYIDNSSYFYRTASTAVTPPPSPMVEFDPTTSEDRNRNGVLDMGEDLNGNGWIDPPGEDVNHNMTLDAGEDTNNDGQINFGQPFNPTSFQIIQAGRDGVLGNDDDLSNFWPGTRKDYLDSLKQ